MLAELTGYHGCPEPVVRRFLIVVIILVTNPGAFYAKAPFLFYFVGQGAGKFVLWRKGYMCSGGVVIL